MARRCRRPAVYPVLIALFFRRHAIVGVPSSSYPENFIFVAAVVDHK